MLMSAKFSDKARRELGENDEKKNECLCQFRDWIQNHSFIKSCRQDDNFLLQFLRIRKFHMQNTFESFENFFIFRKKYERWCNNDDEAMERLWELFEAGYAFPLIERDDEGKKIIFVQARNFNTEKFTSSDAIRLLGLIVMTLMEEEETQIAGISTISDFTDVGYNYFKLFSIRDIKDFADCAKNASVGREKENFFVNLPSFAAILFDIGRKALTEKLRQRLITARTMTHLKNYIDSNLLPQEHGGSVPQLDMIQAFKRLHKTHEKNIKSINVCDIDWSAIESKPTCSIM